MEQTAQPPSGTVTFVFTDIEGSTGAWDGHHAAMVEALALHDRLVAELVERHHGYVFSTGGDGVAAAFQSAREGLAAAIALQRAVARTTWPAPLSLRVRIGINSGDAVERDGDYFGPAVIRAARLMALVDGGRTVCSAATAALVGPHLPDEVELIPLGTVQLRGLSGEERVFAASGPGLAETGVPLVDNRTTLRGPPTRHGSLVGRVAEVAAARSALGKHALVTVTGIGGMGKTRLALEIAHLERDQFVDGVAWADLATAVDSASAMFEIATALGVRAHAGDTVVDGVAEVLAHRNLLLVLDNCEHLRSDVSDLLGTIAGGNATSRVMATSRERLGLPHEYVMSLGPLDTLDPGAARTLLLGGLDSVTERDVRDVDVIVAHTDGIPLAIELAAARCRALGMREVALRLGDRRRMLSDHMRPIERHRVLDTVVAWSYDSLHSSEQEVFRRLSVFGGPFPLSSAEAVAAGTTGTSFDDAHTDLFAAVHDGIAALVDRSLVLKLSDGFRLLEPVRQFAAARLQESGEADVILDLHLAHIVARADEVHDGLATPSEAHYVSQLDLMWPDVRLAMRRAFETGDSASAAVLCTRLANEAFHRRPEAFAWITQAVDQFGLLPGSERAALLGAGSYVAWITLDIERGLSLAERALDACAADVMPFDCLPQAGALGAFNYSNRPADAIAVAVIAFERYGAAMPPSTRVALRASEMISRCLAGESGVAERAEAALATEARGASPSWVGTLWFALALARAFSGDADGAALARDRARTLAASVGNQWLLGMCSGGGPTHGAMDERLATILDAADDALRSGWTTHGWTIAWSVVDPLVHLGEVPLAAMWIGACQSSGIPDFGVNEYTAELRAAIDGAGQPDLMAAIALGRSTPFAELQRRTSSLLLALGA